MVASVAEVVNEDVPVTVSTPLCVRLPTRSVTVRFRPMLEAASVVATLFVRLASPLVPPVVLSAIAPFSVLPVLVSVIVAFVAEVVNDEVPPTVSTPFCVRLPTVSVTVRLPPTFEAPSTVALALVRLALPFAPLVLNDAAPVSRLPALVSVMVAFEAEVVDDDVPPTDSTPVCVRLPTRSVTTRFRPMLEAASVVATLFVRLASAVPPVVLSAIAPLSALPVLVSVMVAFVAEVVNEDVPATVKAPVCVRLPTVSVIVRLPPTFEAPSTVAEVVNDDVPPTVSAPLCVRLPTRSVITRFRPMLDAASVVATLFVRLASPLVPPVVLSAIAPVSALPALVSVIVALFAEVVNEDVPATVRAPVCVRLPTVSVTVRLPPTFEAPSTVALALVRLALPVAPLVLSDAAPVNRLALVSVMVASAAEVVNDEVPATVSTPV